MNLSSPLFAVLGIIVLAVAALSPKRLLAVWVASILVLPLARYRIGEAPIYFHDFVMVTLLVVYRVGRLGDHWPASVPRWHWWVSGTAFVLSVIMGTFQHGWAAANLWIWGHLTLAWVAFGLGVLATSSTHGEALQKNLRLGILISMALLAPIAFIQYLDLPAAAKLMQFFYQDIGAEHSVEQLRLGALSNRAPGPHFAPTGFGGIALLAVAVFWLITRREHRWQRWLVLGCSSSIILCTVSRHVLLAAVMGLVVIFFLGEARLRLRLLAAGAAFAMMLVVLAPNIGIMRSWEKRASRIESGVLADENFVARIVDGPLRLVKYLKNYPATLLMGAGLDADKIANPKMATRESGYVSNSFLLPLYYLGIPGLLLYAGFWLWAAWRAFKMSSESRAVACGMVMVAVVLIVSDNYCFDYEPVVALLFLIPGLIGGMDPGFRLHELIVEEDLPVDLPLPRPAVEEPAPTAYVAPPALYIVAPAGYIAMPSGEIVVPPEQTTVAAGHLQTGIEDTAVEHLAVAVGPVVPPRAPVEELGDLSLDSLRNEVL